MSHTTNSTKSKSKYEHLKKLGRLVIALLVVFNTIQLTFLSTVVQRVDHYNRGVVDEIGSLRHDVGIFAGDLNEIRQFLNLELHDYSFLQKNATIEGQDTVEQKDELKTNSAESALYQFLIKTVDETKAKKKNEEAEQFFQSLSKEQTLFDHLKQKELILTPQSTNDQNFSFTIGKTEGPTLFTLLIPRQTAKPMLGSILGMNEVQAQSPGNIASAIWTAIDNDLPKVEQGLAHLKKQREGFFAWSQQEDIAALLQSKKIAVIMPPEEKEDLYIYTFQNSAGEMLTTLNLRKKDGVFLLQDKSYQTVAELAPILQDFMKNVDVSTHLEKQLRDRQAELETIFKQKTFADVLKNNGMSIKMPARFEHNKVFYDIIDTEGRTVFSFLIEISSGLFKVFKDGQEIDLWKFLEAEDQDPNSDAGADGLKKN